GGEPKLITFCALKKTSLARLLSASKKTIAQRDIFSQPPMPSLQTMKAAWGKSFSHPLALAKKSVCAACGMGKPKPGGLVKKLNRFKINNGALIKSLFLFAQVSKPENSKNALFNLAFHTELLVDRVFMNVLRCAMHSLTCALSINRTMTWR